MKKLIFPLCLIVVLCVSCNNDNETIMAESHEWIIFTSQKSSNGIELWSKNKHTKEKNLLLTTHRHLYIECDSSIMVPKDSITTVDGVKILSWNGEPLTLLIEEKSDLRNVSSYIYTQGSDSVIQLPTNAGLVGLTEEDGLLVMQNYDYYKNGGRYNILRVFDRQGKLLDSLVLNRNNYE